MNGPVFLIGMPGAGKTHWARLWAEVHGWRFTDLDALVEVMEDTTIPEIFETRGERGFRDAEQRALHYLLDRVEAPTIIACGGGTPAYEDNLDRMLESGYVVYLRASSERLATQLLQSSKARPLLAAGKEAAALLPLVEKILKLRAHFFSRAHLTLDVEGLTEASFAEISAACTNRL